MVDTENLHTSINNALINIENLKRWLVKIEQEFTDDNYPNWHFDVVFDKEIILALKKKRVQTKVAEIEKDFS